MIEQRDAKPREVYQPLRVALTGTTVSPGIAVLRFFIPFYNLYWYFAGTTGLVNGYNRALAAYGSPARA